MTRRARAGRIDCRVESTVTWVLGGVSGKKMGRKRRKVKQTVPISPRLCNKVVVVGRHLNGQPGLVVTRGSCLKNVSQ